MQFNNLELIRSKLQSIEAIQVTVSQLIDRKQAFPKESVIVQHQINNLLTLAKQSAITARQLIQEKEVLQAELAILGGSKPHPSLSGNRQPDVWSNFYSRIRNIKQQTTKQTEVEDVSSEFFKKIAFQPPFKKPEFSLQENNGRYLDMHSLYVQLINIKEISQARRPGDYLWYLNKFDKFDQVKLSARKKGGKSYMSYLQNLMKYLKGFLQKSRPLNNIQELDSELQASFNQEWDKGRFQQKIQPVQNKEKSLMCLTCTVYFNEPSRYIQHINGKKHLRKTKKGQTQGQLGQIKDRDMFRLQFYISKYRDYLGNWVYDTINLVRKKQTKQYQQPVQKQQNSQKQQSIDSQEPVYNPKNLPIGWDGKPIPYWLYKMHGLGIQYKCQICGNYSYWGRKAFQRHFMQWRHNYGMKCLKIPNTIHFRDITSISDALSLHSRLLNQSKNQRFLADNQQQFQDNQGNIISKKMREDLYRQGLL